MLYKDKGYKQSQQSWGGGPHIRQLILHISLKSGCLWPLGWARSCFVSALVGCIAYTSWSKNIFLFYRINADSIKSILLTYLWFLCISWYFFLSCLRVLFGNCFSKNVKSLPYIPINLISKIHTLHKSYSSALFHFLRYDFFESVLSAFLEIW